MGLLQQLLADRSPVAPAIDHRLEIAAKMHHPNGIDKLRTTLVIPYRATTRPYAPRSTRRSWPDGIAPAILASQQEVKLMRRRFREPRPAT